MALGLERRLAATAVAVVVAAVGAGTAAACDHGGNNDGQFGVRAAHFAVAHRDWDHHHGGLLSVPAAYLGVSTDQLKAQLRSGQTLAQIANATAGKSAQGLIDYVVATAKAKLDAKVAAGMVTQDQENAWLAKLTDVVTAVVNGTWHR